MKTRYLLCLILFSATILFTCPTHAAESDGEWYPFVIPEKLDPDSPANIGKLVLDPPAGKHGFVKVKDGHFYFEDGTRAKFWGTNLCFNACFPTKEQAEILVDRLAFFGFNAVRLTHMDFYFEPRGIFEDTNPDAKDPRMKKTTKLSERQLDKLDYLIYELKKRGIYVDMNLLVSRHFTKADGVVDADKLGMAAKPVSMFDPKLIELQKQYAKDLLTHYNPYTKLKYCDDPAVALVEITNENSLIAYWKQDRLNPWSPYSHAEPIPAHYIKELDALWGKNTHRPLYNALKLYPKITQDEIQNFYIGLEKKYFNEMVKFLKDECDIKIPVTGIGGYQTGEDIDAQASCDFIDKHTYWDHPRFFRKKWDKNDFYINDKSIFSNRKLGIIESLKKSRPKNKKPYTVTEWNHCYPNPYAYETPVLLASEAVKNNWDGLFQFTFVDGWKTTPALDDIRGYFDIVANSQQLILNSAGSLIFLNNSKVETVIDGKTIIIKSPRVSGVVGFIKNRFYDFGTFSIRPDQNGAVLFVKNSGGFLFMTVGEVKNTDSGWRGICRFDWGNGPVLLKNIGVNVTTDDHNKMKIYKLTETGSRYREPLSGSMSYCPWFEIITE